MCKVKQGNYPKPRRKTRYRIRRLKKSIAMLEYVRDFAYPEDLASVEKKLRHCRGVIEDKRRRYSNSLELCGVKKDIAEAQQEIRLNKEVIRRTYENLASMKSYLRNAADTFSTSDYQAAGYSYLKLKVIKTKEEIQELKATLIKLGKEQSDLKKNLRRNQRSLADPHCNKEK